MKGLDQEGSVLVGQQKNSTTQALHDGHGNYVAQGVQISQWLGACTF